MASTISEKMFLADYNLPSKTPSFLEKAVKWYKRDLTVSTTVKTTATIAIVAFLSYQVVFSPDHAWKILPLPLLYYFKIWKIKGIAYIIDLEESIHMFNRRKSVENMQPPSIREIKIKSDTRTYNHINDYVIENNLLWSRSRIGLEEDRKWECLYFDGDINGAKPKKVLADGANLCVIDDKGGVHYRKVLIEGRGYKETNHSRLKNHFKHKINLPKEDRSSYVVVDKTKKINWKHCWFSLPVLNEIANLITGDRLYISPDVSVAMSHRGRYNFGYTDAAGKWHQSQTGTSALNILQSDGRSILQYDPWVPLFARFQIHFPETPSTVFVAKKIDASASTIMAIGYEIDVGTREGKLKILTNFCDIDIIGANPFIKYAYEGEKIEGKDIRILSDVVLNNGWSEHPLPADVIECYSQISISQTGVDVSARELRVAVQRMDREVGIYCKSLEPNSKWFFISDKNIDFRHSLRLDEKFPNLPLTSSVQNYKGTCIDNKTKQSISVELKNFGKNASHYPFRLTMSNQEYNLALHKRIGWRTFLGIKHEVYDLVIPKVVNDQAIKDAFGGRQVMRIKVENIGGKQVMLHFSGKDIIFPKMTKLMAE